MIWAHHFRVARRCIAPEMEARTYGLPTSQHWSQVRIVCVYPWIGLNVSDSLAEEVFALTRRDVYDIIKRNQMAPCVFMTEPWDRSKLPFITVSITKSACFYFKAMRQRVM